MRALLLPGVGAPLELVERDVPEPGPGQARVRVQACGVCGSDLFLQKGGFGADKLPVVPGHEAAGVVDAVGEGVSAVAVGDQVALYYIDNPPGAPRPNLGPDVQRMGVDVDGAFADYVVRPASTLIVPPAPVDPATLAVLTDAVGTPYHGLARIARVQPGETVAVLGIGGIGSNAVQVAAALGARVIAVSRRADKLALARSLGAEAAVTMADARDAIGGAGADVVVQCADSPQLDEAAIALGGYGARIVLIGASVDPFAARSSDLIWRELSVMGSRGFTPEDIREVIDLFLAGTLRADHLTSVQRPLEEGNAALDDLREGRVLRSVLVP
jgi:D-arabinose 1-dehydrogenase-like Zn-dependent alcohol dehydrogenase